MNQKKLKRLRRKLRDERNENALVSVGSEGPLNPTILEQRQHSAVLPKRLLMRRKDPISPRKAERSGSLPGAMVHQGGAILHPMSERAMYQFAKKKGPVE